MRKITAKVMGGAKDCEKLGFVDEIDNLRRILRMRFASRSRTERALSATTNVHERRLGAEESIEGLGADSGRKLEGHRPRDAYVMQEKCHIKCTSLPSTLHLCKASSTKITISSSVAIMAAPSEDTDDGPRELDAMPKDTLKTAQHLFIALECAAMRLAAGVKSSGEHPAESPTSSVVDAWNFSAHSAVASSSCWPRPSRPFPPFSGTDGMDVESAGNLDLSVPPQSLIRARCGVHRRAFTISLVLGTSYRRKIIMIRPLIHAFSGTEHARRAEADVVDVGRQH
ncbi:hypothetical protein R3P38DRAFT_2806690 [Favolaschia claudopus]|uniref:Uncharacterized protein n=1 Tax=Favolaschia claudopus TaxID=2862362 RepID=A0AAV9ZIW9_9AGAR